MQDENTTTESLYTVYTDAEARFTAYRVKRANASKKNRKKILDDLTSIQGDMPYDSVESAKMDKLITDHCQYEVNPKLFKKIYTGSDRIELLAVLTRHTAACLAKAQKIIAAGGVKGAKMDLDLTFWLEATAFHYQFKSHWQSIEESIAGYKRAEASDLLSDEDREEARKFAAQLVRISYFLVIVAFS